MTDPHGNPGFTDQNVRVLEIIKRCTNFLHHDEIKIGKKLNDLNLLYYTWGEDADEDYSADVYAAMVEMLSVNAFRPLPPTTYACGDEENAAVAAASYMPPPPPPSPVRTDDGSDGAAADAYAQSAMAYTAFLAFMDRAAFDSPVCAAYADRRFAGGLAQRFNSAVVYERMLVRETVGRLWSVCPPARQRLLDATVAELADLAYGYVPRHNGVDDLLGFCADTVADQCAGVGPAELEKLFRVLVRLLKHNLLFVFKCKLIECIRAFNNDHPDLIPRVLESILKLWSCHNRKTAFLLCTMVELHEWCNQDKWIALQLRVVDQLSKLFNDEDFQLAEGAMNFCNNLLYSDVSFWQKQKTEVRTIVDALQKVNQSHWNTDCAKIASGILKIMISKNLTKAQCGEEIPEETNQDGEPGMTTLYRSNQELQQVNLKNVEIDASAEAETTVQ